MKTKSDRSKGYPANLFVSGLAVLLLLTGSILLSLFFIRGLKYEETNDAQVESYINPISARVGGYLSKVYFLEHEGVKKGDTLLTLDDREYRAKLSEAQAAVEDATAQLDVLDASIKVAAAGTIVNKDQIHGATAKYAQQLADIKRYENLLKEEAATGSDFDLIKSRFEVAKSDLDASKNTWKTGVARISELKARTALLNADLKKKRALLDLAKINLNYTVVLAPYSGRMGRKVVLEGQQIQAGAPLVSIVDESEKWVTANFKETQVNGMFVGQVVELTIDAIENKTFKGKILAISGSTGSKFSLLPPDNSTGNFVKTVQRVPVKISIEEKDLEPFKAGMSVNVAVRKKGA